MAAVMENVKRVLHDFQLKFPLQIEKRQKLNLFSPVLDEEEFADCFYGLYINSTKKMKKKYGEKEYDKMRFSAFLYYLVKVKGFKGDNFSQTRFYEFIQKKVFCDLKQNVRTFNNRVTELNILDKAVKHPMDYAKNPDFKDFQHLEKEFRESDFFKSLKNLFGRVFKPM